MRGELGGKHGGSERNETRGAITESGDCGGRGRIE